MVKLRTLRLENFQSWRDATVEFSDGLNAISATGCSNNTGKSVIFKALKLTCDPDYFSRQEKKQLIRHGYDFARITYMFSDGSYAKVTLTRAKVLYDCSFGSSEGVPPLPLLDNLSVILSPTNKYMVNIIDSIQSTLLVNSDEKGNYGLMTALTEHKELKELLELFKSKEVEYTRHSIKVGGRADRLERQMNSIEVSDIPKLETELETLELCEDAISIAEYFSSYIYYMGRHTSKYYPWKEFADILVNIPENLKYPDDIPWARIANCLNIPQAKVVEDIPWEDFIKLLNINIAKVPEDIPWKDISKILNINVPNIKPEFPNVAPILKLFSSVDELTTSVQRLEQLEQEIAEIRAIDFNGTEYDCPVHGKIIYKDGMCIHGEK